MLSIFWLFAFPSAVRPQPICRLLQYAPLQETGSFFDDGIGLRHFIGVLADGFYFNGVIPSFYFEQRSVNNRQSIFSRHAFGTALHTCFLVQKSSPIRPLGVSRRLIRSENHGHWFIAGCFEKLVSLGGRNQQHPELLTGLPHLFLKIGILQRL